MSKVVTQEDWILRAVAKHGNFYNYDKAVYTRAKDKLIVICPIHGDFEVEALSHLSCGCKGCAKDKLSNKYKFTKEQFVEKSIKAHGDLYDYSAVVYQRANIDVDIICKHHGKFSMLPSNHSRQKEPQGCPKCGDERMALGQTKTQEEFLSDCFAEHGTKWDYTPTVYTNDKVESTSFVRLTVCLISVQEITCKAKDAKSAQLTATQYCDQG